MRIKTSVPDALPLKRLKWDALAPLAGEANRLLGRVEERLQRAPKAALMMREAKETFKAQPRPQPEEIQKCLKALHLIRRKRPQVLSPAFLRQLHALLTRKEPGRIRTRQNWVGPTGCRMEEAFCYPPAPRYVLPDLKKLAKYAASQDGDPLMQTGIIFAQFLMIHPFMDGNGRVARLLIPYLLYTKKVTREPLFYMSAYFQKNRKEYFDRLLALSKDHDWEGWMVFFLKGVIEEGKGLLKKIPRETLGIKRSD